MIGAALGQMVGREFGSYLGRQLALGACRDDREDDLERRPFEAMLHRGQIPAAVDLRPWMTPVENQGRLGSCAANALVGAAEYLFRRETGQHVDLSRQFVYFAQRLWDDAVRDDLGASIGDGIRVMSRLGVPTEGAWPYHDDLFAVQPTEAVLREASTFKVVDWWSVPVHPDAFRGCLAAGFPIAFGTKVTQSFVETPRNGICGMPQGADDRRHGRHALLAVGYDDRHSVFVVRNSWGHDWGDAGYVYMPYAYVLNPNWTSGCWALRLTDRDAFDPAQHGGANLGALPKAPPAGSGGASTVGSVASMGAQVAVGAFTGSGLLAGLAGGLISGLTPGVSKALRGRDRGAFVEVDRAEWMINVLRGAGPVPARFARFSWDDGYDEEAIVEAVGSQSAQRNVRIAGRVAAEGVAPSRSRPAGAPSVSGTSVSGAGSGVIAAVAGGAAEVFRRSPSPRGEASIDDGSIDPRSFEHDPFRPHSTRSQSTPEFQASNRDPVPAPISTVSLPPALDEAWRREGGVNGSLGVPLTGPVEMLEGAYRGSYVRFTGGVMCAWQGPPGAPAPPPITLIARRETVAKWLALGAGASVCGWPVGAVIDDGRFEILPCTRGSVIHHPEHGAHPLFGAIFAYWRSLGGLKSDLGAPLADPMLPSDPRAPTTQRFENGTLGWCPARGAYRS